MEVKSSEIFQWVSDRMKSSGDGSAKNFIVLSQKSGKGHRPDGQLSESAFLFLRGNNPGYVRSLQGAGFRSVSISDFSASLLFTDCTHLLCGREGKYVEKD